MDDFFHYVIEGIAFCLAVTMFFFLLNGIAGLSEASNKNIHTKSSITMSDGTEKFNSTDGKLAQYDLITGADVFTDMLNTVNSTKKDVLKNGELKIKIDGAQVDSNLLVALKEQKKTAVEEINDKIRDGKKGDNFYYTKTYEYNEEMRLETIDYVEVVSAIDVE